VSSSTRDTELQQQKIAMPMNGSTTTQCPEQIKDATEYNYSSPQTPPGFEAT
jgi:hypothetical protein